MSKLGRLIRAARRRATKKKPSGNRRGGNWLWRQHLREIIARDGLVCKLCGDAIDPLVRHPHPFSLSIDHITPVSLGGGHEPSNLQLAHLRCNLVKGAGRPRGFKYRRHSH